MYSIQKDYLVRKYNQSGPRYTSYPPVPFWKEQIPEETWKESLIRMTSKEPGQGISLYIHLPFCESLCTYCGCNTRITVNHNVESPYIEAVLKEWSMYRSILPPGTMISEMHLGGGTPTFFSASNLYYLLSNILKGIRVSPNPEFSIEGHPNSTTERQLKTLSTLGFRRISYGIQDFDPVVQKAIHRFQSFEQVECVTNLSRNNGFESVNFDLIYGLPFQTKNSINDTFRKVIRLMPDRIAYYGYAHVPWIKPGQRSYSEKDLPDPELRLELYELGRELLEENGYYEIGMDHFALKSDSLYKSVEGKTLNRNFMGYTTSQSKVTLGLGVSSISDNGEMYSQNVKTVEEYYRLLEEDKLPLFRGHTISADQRETAIHIHNLMCNFETSFDKNPIVLENSKQQLLEMQRDGLLELKESKIMVTPTGRRFVRNICMAIDPMLKEKKEGVFSSTQ